MYVTMPSVWFLFSPCHQTSVLTWVLTSVRNVCSGASAGLPSSHSRHRKSFLLLPLTLCHTCIFTYPSKSESPKLCENKTFDSLKIQITHLHSLSFKFLFVLFHLNHDTYCIVNGENSNYFVNATSWQRFNDLLCYCSSENYFSWGWVFIVHTSLFKVCI